MIADFTDVGSEVLTPRRAMVEAFKKYRTMFRSQRNLAKLWPSP